MLIATWNVNSIRSRLDHVQGWLKDVQPDILCLQETKVSDADFPQTPFTDLGYHCTLSGQKSYNGVAILSRDPVTVISYGFGDPQWDNQKRLLHVQIQGQTLRWHIVNVYVPNGSDLNTDKYHYKLGWLERLLRYLQPWVGDPLVLGGDFNIAPDDRDYFDPICGGGIMASQPERQALQSLLDLPLVDAFRQFTGDAGHYSWWDYRQGSFRRNRGWRIDHLYVSPAAQPHLQRCWIDLAPRHLDKPSDHTPVILELKMQNS